MAAVNVQNRVAKAQGFLPAEVTKVGVITSKRQTSMLLVFSLYSSDDKYDNEFLENYAKINVIPEVQRVPGVGDAMVMGSDYSMRIWLKPEIMAQYHLMPTDISTALAEQNIEAAPGSLGERGNQTFQYTLKYKGRLQSQEEFENIVIRATADGEVLRLKDVANVELGRLTYGFANKTNGHPSVTAIIFQTAGSNATQIIKDCETLLKNAEKTMPPGVKVSISQNANDFLFASIHEVIKTLIEAFILVFIVVYIFLQDLRSTLIPAIAIPVALIGTFFVLYIIGFSINLLTLCAMVLAIAIVVDDAIVVVEGVHAKLDQGYKSARLASIDAMSELGGAIVSITLVMMSVFIPVSFMSGTSGVFYRQFGLTMAIAIGLSAVNALTLTPALCAILLKPHDPEERKKSTFVSRFHTAFNVYYDGILKKYKKGTLNFIHKPWLTIGSVVAGIALLLFFMKITPTGLVPNEDTGTIMAVVDLPPGTSQDRTEQVLMQIDSLLASEPAIESRTMISGYSFMAGQGPGYGSFICKLKNWDDRTIEQRSDFVSGMLYLKARKVIKDARVLLFAPPMIPGYSVSNGFELNLQDKTGGDVTAFKKEADRFVEALSRRPEIGEVYSSFAADYPQYWVDIDAAKCEQSGISPADVLSTLSGYYTGSYVSDFNRFSKLYHVTMQAPAEYRINTESLNRMYVRTSDGSMAPLSQFVRLTKTNGPSDLTRFNLFNAIAINGSPVSGYSSGQVIKAIGETAREVLPATCSYEFGGLSREESKTTNNAALIFILCMVLIYLILCALYESVFIPFAVLLSVPCGLMGSFLFAWLFGLENNIYMQTGLIMIIGLLAKTAILLTEYAGKRRSEGMTLSQAAYSAAKVRLRPILMTVLSMVFGLIPLMMAHGVGANGSRSLATGVIGGMIVGTLALLFLVPSLFITFQYIQEQVKRK